MITETIVDAFYAAAGAVKDTVLFKIRSLEEFPTERDAFAAACASEIDEATARVLFAAMAVSFYGKTRAAVDHVIGAEYDVDPSPSSFDSTVSILRT